MSAIDYENIVHDDAKTSLLRSILLGAAKSSGFFAILVLAMAVAYPLGIWFQDWIAYWGLLPRPEMPDSETEVREWWLVSPLAARALRANGQPVLQFCELYLWGRTQGRGGLEDDPDLAAAARPPEPQSPSGW